VRVPAGGPGSDEAKPREEMLRKLRLRPAWIRRTGDDTPARSLYGYVWRMSGWHQAWLSLLAALVAGLSMAPLELQRRIVNNAIGGEDLPLLGVLAALYLAVVVVQTGLKYLLRVGQAWLGESAIRYTRRHLFGIHQGRSGPDPGDEASRNESGGNEGGREGGRAVSIIGAEVEQLGGFVGEAVAEPLVTGGMLLAILGYMFVVEPVLAAACLVFFVPQAIGVPLIQSVVNRFVERRIGLLRDFGGQVADVGARSDQPERGPDPDRDHDAKLDAIYGNRIRIFLWKFASKGLVNLFNGLAPVTALVVGGYLVIVGQTSLGVVVAFTSGFERLADPLRELIAFYRLAAQSRVRHEAIARWM
jgi:ABC-type multidrug transport system fused ATPase/permease subunit